MREVFKPRAEKIWTAIGFSLTFLAILIIALIDAATTQKGQASAVMISLFWLLPLALSLWLLVYFNVFITVTQEGIERAGIFGTKNIGWHEIKELTRNSSKDRFLTIKSAHTKISFDCHYFEKGDRLRNLVLPHLSETPLPRELVWRPFFTGCGWLAIILDCATVACFVGIGIYSPQLLRDPIAMFSLIGFLAIPTLMWQLISLGLHWVTDDSVRADPFCGYRKELKWHELKSVSVYSDAEAPEFELLTLEGYVTTISLRSNLTPNYAQVRDKILEKAKCPIRRD